MKRKLFKLCISFLAVLIFTSSTLGVSTFGANNNNLTMVAHAAEPRITITDNKNYHTSYSTQIQ